MHVISSKLNPSPTAVRTAIHCCIIVQTVAICTRLSARHGASVCGKFTVFSTAVPVWTSTARLIFSKSLSFLRDYNSRSLIQCGPRGAAPFVVRIRHIWCCRTSPMVRKLGENLPICCEGPVPAGDNININHGKFTTHVRRMFLPHCSQIGTQIQIQAASFKLPIRGSSIHAHVS